MSKNNDSAASSNSQSQDSFSKAYPGIAHALTSVLQTGENSVFRNATQAVKAHADFAGKGRESFISRVMKDMAQRGPFKFFTTGLQSRFQSQLMAMGSASFATKMLEKYYPDVKPVEKAFTASLIEVLAGSYKEVLSNQKSFEQITRTKMQPADIRAATLSVMVPFFCRNFLGWSASFAARSGSSEQISLMERMAIGVFAGMCSTPFDTFGNLVMKNAAGNAEANNSAAERAWKAIIDTALKTAENPREFLNKVKMGALPRAVAGAAGAVIFSADNAEGVRESIDTTIVACNNFLTAIYEQFGEIAADNNNKSEHAGFTPKQREMARALAAGREVKGNGIAAALDNNASGVTTRASVSQGPDSKTAPSSHRSVVEQDARRLSSERS